MSALPLFVITDAAGAGGRFFAGEFLITHRRIVGECRHQDRRLLHVVILGAVPHIHRGVPGACSVFDRILNELESRKSDASNA
jgi:hypothetical protein